MKTAITPEEKLRKWSVEQATKLATAKVIEEHQYSATVMALYNFVEKGGALVQEEINPKTQEGES